LGLDAWKASALCGNDVFTQFRIGYYRAHRSNEFAVAWLLECANISVLRARLRPATRVENSRSLLKINGAEKHIVLALLRHCFDFDL
jgi:hypothetical protein